MKSEKKLRRKVEQDAAPDRNPRCALVRPESTALMHLNKLFLFLVVLVSASPAYCLSLPEPLTKIAILKTEMALHAYHEKYGKYPSTLQGIDLLIREGLLEERPTDGWGYPLVYTNHIGQEFELLSYGRYVNKGKLGKFFSHVYTLRTLLLTAFISIIFNIFLLQKWLSKRNKENETPPTSI